MTKGKQYVTQISRKDLDEIADATNIHSGVGIVVARGDSGIEVSVDKQALRMWVQRIIQGGQI